MSADEVYPVGTVVRLKKTGQFALITDVAFLTDNKTFLNYLGHIEGRGDGKYAIFHQDVDLEVLPPGYIPGGGKPVRVEG